MAGRNAQAFLMLLSRFAHLTSFSFEIVKVGDDFHQYLLALFLLLAALHDPLPDFKDGRRGDGKRAGNL